jgi:hypothetical protein
MQRRIGGVAFGYQQPIEVAVSATAGAEFVESSELPRGWIKMDRV